MVFESGPGLLAGGLGLRLALPRGCGYLRISVYAESIKAEFPLCTGFLYLLRNGITRSSRGVACFVMGWVRRRLYAYIYVRNRPPAAAPARRARAVPLGVRSS